MVLIQPYLLICAQSGRMLAQAAKDAGFQPLVMDVFGDQDCQGLATDYQRVASLSEQNLTPALDYFFVNYPVTHAIYGSGFEQLPESLNYLHRHLDLLGNSPDSFIKVQNKPAFFDKLAELNIAYPEVVFCIPSSAETWLLKPMQGQGGIGIKRFRPEDKIDFPAYRQKFQPGIPHSVLFLADGNNAKVIGFNRQWTVKINDDAEFMFAGVINQTNLSALQKALVGEWLTKLVPAFGLKGLNSLDFIQDGDNCWLLEINPRFSASMQLYDEDLLHRHIAACQGQLSDFDVNPAEVTAYQIVYAHETVQIPQHYQWPSLCVDLPSSGVICHTGQPICSMIARHNSAENALELLKSTQQQLINSLRGSHSHGIPS